MIRLLLWTLAGILLLMPRTVHVPPLATTWIGMTSTSTSTTMMLVLVVVLRALGIATVTSTVTVTVIPV
jgi:hypothetical protein